MAQWMAKAAALTRPGALDDLALVVDQEQVAHPDLLEAHAERVHPEVVGQLGVAGGDVAGDALVEAEVAEEPEAGRQALLAVAALVLDRLERRQGVGLAVARPSGRRIAVAAAQVLDRVEIYGQVLGRHRKSPLGLDRRVRLAGVPLAWPGYPGPKRLGHGPPAADSYHVAFRQ